MKLYARIKILMPFKEGDKERHIRLADPQLSLDNVHRFPSDKIEKYFERVLAMFEERFSRHPLADDSLCQRLETEDPLEFKRLYREWQGMAKELETVLDECSRWYMRHNVSYALQLVT